MDGMKAGICLIGLALFLDGPNGCDQSSKPASPAPQPVAKTKHYPLHRFENVPSTQSPGIALDTVTGQFCRTWDWTYKIKTLNGGLDELPTCVSIFRDFPSEDNSQ
jgi:hypothetical protein